MDTKEGASASFLVCRILGSILQNMGSSSNAEILKFISGLFPFTMNLFDDGARWALTTPSCQFIELSPWTLRNHFNRAVVAISHPSG